MTFAALHVRFVFDESKRRNVQLWMIDNAFDGIDLLTRLERLAATALANLLANV